jgi:hypothetical protein
LLLIRKNLFPRKYGNVLPDSDVQIFTIKSSERFNVQIIEAEKFGISIFFHRFKTKMIKAESHISTR